MKLYLGLLLLLMLCVAGCAMEDHPGDEYDGMWDISEEFNQEEEPDRSDPGDVPQQPDVESAPDPDADATEDGDTPDEVGEEEEPDGVDREEDIDEQEEDVDEQEEDVEELEILEECDGEVVNIAGDAENCGACDVACDPKFGVCQGGVCGCGQGLTPCGPDDRCEDLQIDPNHCGACGVQCGPGQICQDGECVCRPEFTDCDGVCRDTRRNPNHCGSCNNSCGTDACLQGQCSATCQVSSGTGQVPCAPVDSDGLSCEPLSADAFTDLSCGSAGTNLCGPACEGAEVCGFSGCRSYRAARGCVQCPCNECGPGENCRVDFPVEGGIYCVSQTSN